MQKLGEIMNEKLNENTKLLLIINTLRKIIEIFLGPFLTAYLFRVAIDNIQTISIYNIYSYVVIALIALLIGRILKNKCEMPIFRLGMISKFIQLMIIVILGDNVIHYLWILAFVSGLSTETWSFPLNLFSSTLVTHNEKNSYVVYRTMLTNLTKILTPFLLGSLISMKNFQTTAIIILILSFIQIILSFKLKLEKQEKEEKQTLHLVEEFKKIRKNDNLKRFYRIKFFKGMAYEGALDTAVTLLIIMAFQSDFSLGIITSFVSILAMISSYLYKRFSNTNKVKSAIIFSCIILLLTSIILVFVTNQHTIIGYNLIFAFFLQFILVAEEIQTLKFTNSNVITDDNRVETYIYLEFFLNAGRVVSYALLFIIGIYQSLFLLEILIIFLVLCIIAEAASLLKFREKRKE